MFPWRSELILRHLWRFEILNDLLSSAQWVTHFLSVPKLTTSKTQGSLKWTLIRPIWCSTLWFQVLIFNALLKWMIFATWHIVLSMRRERITRLFIFFGHRSENSLPMSLTHGVCVKKIGINFYRFNAKNWQFTV